MVNFLGPGVKKNLWFTFRTIKSKMPLIHYMGDVKLEWTPEVQRSSRRGKNPKSSMCREHLRIRRLLKVGAL